MDLGAVTNGTGTKREDVISDGTTGRVGSMCGIDKSDELRRRMSLHSESEHRWKIARLGYY